jgi:hypothetical protein
MLDSWLIFIIIGRVLVWVGMKFPLPNFLNRIEKVRNLHECPLCLGVWIYGIMSYFMWMDLLSALGFFYVPVLSEIVTGAGISFLVHIFVLGWKSMFEVIIV